jgi:putative membrane protein
VTGAGERPVPGVETQPERTALAWQRTGFGVLGIGGLLAHAALRAGGIALVVLACAVALLGLAVLGTLAPRRYRRVRRSIDADADADAAVGAGPGVRLVAGAVLLTALAGITAVILLLR